MRNFNEIFRKDVIILKVININIMIILKVTKNQGFTLSLEDTQGGGSY